MISSTCFNDSFMNFDSLKDPQLIFFINLLIWRQILDRKKYEIKFFIIKKVRNKLFNHISADKRENYSRENILKNYT